MISQVKERKDNHFEFRTRMKTRENMETSEGDAENNGTLGGNIVLGDRCICSHYILHLFAKKYFIKTK